MNNKKSIFLIITAVINVLLTLFVITLYFVSRNESLSATDIYNTCLNNVVEIKAESENIGESYGTGEIITTDGKIITNAHVVTYTRLGTVNQFENYYMRFAFEDVYRPLIIEKYSTELDLAILKLKDYSDIILNPIEMDRTSSLKAGDTVYAVGNASNYGISIFQGIVSNPLVNIKLEEVTTAVIQCDLTIAAGNSGGALLNEKGELIGITTFRTKDNSGNVIYGIVYSIPIDTVITYIS